MKQLAWLVVLMLFQASAPAQEQADFFETRIRPVLVFSFFAPLYRLDEAIGVSKFMKSAALRVKYV